MKYRYIKKNSVMSSEADNETKLVWFKTKIFTKPTEPLLDTWEGKLSICRIVWTRTKQVLVGNRGNQTSEG